MRKKSKRFPKRFRSSGIIVETRTIRCIRGSAAKLVKAAERPRGETHSGNSIGQLPWSVWHCPVRSRNATCSPPPFHRSPAFLSVEVEVFGRSSVVTEVTNLARNFHRFHLQPRVFSVSSSAGSRSFFSFVHQFSLPVLSVWHFLLFSLFLFFCSRGRNSRLLSDGRRRLSSVCTGTIKRSARAIMLEKKRTKFWIHVVYNK